MNNSRFDGFVFGLFILAVRAMWDEFDFEKEPGKTEMYLIPRNPKKGTSWKIKVDIETGASKTIGDSNG